MYKRFFKILFFAGSVTAAAAAGAYLHLESWAKTAQELPAERVIKLEQGMPLGTLAERLASRGVVSDALRFRLWVRISGSYPRFQAGQYRFQGRVRPEAIEDKILSGEVYHPIVLKYTIPEGFSLEEILRRLEARGVGSLDELKKLARDPEFLSSLQVPSKNLEGYLYPATYKFHEDPSPKKALRRMVKAFWDKLPQNYERRVKEKGLSLHEAVTFASLIEKETKFDDERPLISEVVWNRLKKGEPLAIDASIIYGLDDYKGDLRWKHLEDTSNPYNTRTHKGLPPTPIGAPSKASLRAVLNPTDKGYFYFVLKPGTGRHHFSKSLEEHNRHVQKLVNATRDNE